MCHIECCGVSVDYYRGLHSSVILSWKCKACTVMMNEPNVSEVYRSGDSFFDEDDYYANIEQENANEIPTIDNINNYPNCPICKEDVQEDQDRIHCDMCLVWPHKTCLHLTNEESEDVVYANPWFCSYCLSIKSNKITWGEYEGEEAIKNIIQSTDNNILKWKKNIFKLPHGKWNCFSERIDPLT